MPNNQNVTSDKMAIKTNNSNNDYSIHFIDQEEVQQFIQHINIFLNQQESKPIHDLFDEAKDGILLSKLINAISPGTIDERVLNSSPMNMYQMIENNTLVLGSAKAIGCIIINIGPKDLIEKREHLVLGLIWQLIKKSLLSKVNLKFHPELCRLLEEGETLENLLNQPADALLLRWFNYHLKKAGTNARVTNFSQDLMNLNNYLILLSQLCPDKCDKGLAISVQGDSNESKVELVLDWARKINVDQYITRKTLLDGNPRLNLAFVATLFNNFPGLKLLSNQELADFDETLFNQSFNREVQAFTLWINSLHVEPYINNLFEDLKDGIILMQLFEKVKPDSIKGFKQKFCWRPLNSFQKISNNNLIVEMAHSLNFSLVGIQGSDIVNGNRTAILALIWQLMRQHVLSILGALGKNVSENDIILWANSMTLSKTEPIIGLKDKSIKNSHFLLNLMDSIRPGLINWKIVNTPVGEDDILEENPLLLNARYCISAARKIGAVIFLVPEDIVELKSKMILTFMGTLMSLHLKDKN